MENWEEFTNDTIAALLEDGSDPDAEYTIEHHFYPSSTLARRLQEQSPPI